MRRDEVLARLKSTEPVLRAIGVAALYLFGSHARDEAQEDSDIDVFVDPAPGVTFGFLPVMAAYEAIEAAAEASMDYGTRSGLHPVLPPADRAGRDRGVLMYRWRLQRTARIPPVTSG